MQLVIVESPTKAKTISRFLGDDYQIEATMGHLRDLPKSKLGVDLESGFRPEWIVVSGKKKRIESLKKAAKGAAKIILATDLDREGEAIAWHVAQILARQVNFSRIVFHEITKNAIERALKNPRKIDMNLVSAQKARRVLDRLVGYKLSPLLWKKVRRGLSAGRVQSVAVRLIVEREKEIKKFSQEEYWRVLVSLTIPDRRHIPIPDRNIFVAELVARKGVKYQQAKVVNLFCGRHRVVKTSIKSEEEVLEIIKDLVKPFVIKDIKKKEAFYNPAAPFTTATLQQAAGRRFGWSAKMTMRIAQGLYERGLITYHRTDSFNLAHSAVQAIRDNIKRNFGAEYLSSGPLVYKTKSRLAQEAHEAIRPTKLNVKADNLRERQDKRAVKLYDLIWRRTVACQMSPARLTKTLLVINCGGYQFESKGQQRQFDGFSKVYPVKFSENILPALKVGDQLQAVSLGAVKGATAPPARYTEAGLIKALEQKGIGRPSTYAPIISVIQSRQYVEKLEGKFKPTHLGEAVNGFLVENFDGIVNIPFTAKMEDEFDQIAKGEIDWVEPVKKFYQPFEKKLKNVEKRAERVKIQVEKTGEKCPECGADLVIKISRFGKFIACSNFPECKFKKAYIEKLGEVKCPKCGGEVVIKRSRKGRKFYGCSSWPKCDWASWRKPNAN